MEMKILVIYGRTLGCMVVLVDLSAKICNYGVK